MVSSTQSSAVEKIQRCHLSQLQICNLNPSTGRRTELIVKQSLERSLTGQGLAGTVHLNDEKDKRIKPDIYLDTCGRSLSVDCRHWTGTESRRGKVYESRELYGTQRGQPSIEVYLQDTRRFLFLAFELAIVDSTGHRERRLFCIPGLWLQDRFAAKTGIPIDEIVESAWPGFSKGKNLLYDIDVLGLIETADSYGPEAV
jgi:hypothetical protein